MASLLYGALMTWQPFNTGAILTGTFIQPQFFDNAPFCQSPLKKSTFLFCPFNVIPFKSNQNSYFKAQQI